METNAALRRALSVGADLRTQDRAKLSIAQIDRLALLDEIDRLTRSERYAWKNTHEIDAERVRFLGALDGIRRLPLDAPDDQWRSMALNLVGEGLSGEPSSPSASSDPK